MDISAMDPQSVQELFDAEVVGPDGERVGTVEQIFADDVTGAPTFITVKNGDRESYIPVSGADLDADTVTIPFSKDVVDAAPAASDAEDLSLEQETSLYRYYGIRPPRRSSPDLEGPDEEPAGSAATPSHAQPEDSEDEGRESSQPQAEDPAGLDEPVTTGQEEPAEEPGGIDEFRSLEEIDESQDPAAPEPMADELPAEEAAMLGGEQEPTGEQEPEDPDPRSADEEDAERDEAEEEASPQSVEEPGLAPAGVAETAAVAGVAGVAGLTGAAVSLDSARDGEDEEPAPDGVAQDGEEPGETSDEPGESAEEAAGQQDDEPDGAEQGAGRPEAPAEGAALPAGARLRKYVVTEMVTVQVPVRREVICYEDADGTIHELETVDAPASAQPAYDPHDPANWWFGDGGKREDPESSEDPES